METRFDTVIVGAGLAGACAARVLSQDRRVLLIDAGDHEAASPAAVAAMASPLMAQKAKPGWRVIDALAAFERMVDDLDCQDEHARSGLVRPPYTSRQAEEFSIVAEGYPELATFLSADEAAERAPWITAPHGLLQVTRGGAVSIPDLLDSIRKDAVARGTEFRSKWHLETWTRKGDQLEAVLRGDSGALRVETSSILMAIGPGFERVEALRQLRLHRVKGQVVRVRPSVMPSGVLPVSGRGYAVPCADGTVVIGSSYEHDFDDSAPTRIQSRRLIARMLSTLPWLKGATILSEYAGLRVTVTGRREPILGPVPDHPGVWILSGLGSKGLLMAPYLAEQLPRWMKDPESIPSEICVRVRRD